MDYVSGGVLFVRVVISGCGFLNEAINLLYFLFHVGDGVLGFFCLVHLYPRCILLFLIFVFCCYFLGAFFFCFLCCWFFG